MNANRHLTKNPHPQPLSHPLGEGGVGLSPVKAERRPRLRFTEPRSCEICVHPRSSAVQRLADVNRAEGVRALETVLEETECWPEVRQAFQNAFALYRQHKTGVTEGTSK